MNFSIQRYEDIEKKIDQIKEEISSISFSSGETRLVEEKKKNKILRLAGRQEALLWVMGRKVI